MLLRVISAAVLREGLGEGQSAMDAYAIWNAVFIVLGIGYFCLLFWAIFDAITQYDIGCAGMGCIWPLLFITVPPILLFYVFMRFYQMRAPSRQLLLERQREEQGLPPAGRFASDIDKLRFLDAAERSHGTMYDPSMDHAAPPAGFRHFTDGRAEALLEQRRYDEAEPYLLDLHAVATAAHDVRSRDTYRHYLSLVPGGLEQLQQQEQRLRSPGREPRSPRRPDVPF